MPYNELAHYGILGMKWGVRRYQNEDGSLTSAGKKRYSTDSDGRKEFINRMTSQTIKVGKDKSNISPAEKIGRETEKMIDSVEKGIDSAYRIRQRHQKPDPSLKKMSDEELRSRINRMNLERQYNDLTESNTNRGRAAATDILAVVGSVVGIASGAVTIYATLKEVKRP